MCQAPLFQDYNTFSKGSVNTSGIQKDEEYFPELLRKLLCYSFRLIKGKQCVRLNIFNIFIKTTLYKHLKFIYKLII